LKTKFYLCILLAGWALLGTSNLFGQDIHFSQFYNTPLTVGPALTGMYRGDLRFSGAYRSQWDAANSPYRTFHLSVDKKFYKVTHTKWWFSGGLSFFYDRAGDGNLATTHAALLGSYTRMMDQRNFLTAGVFAGIGQRRFEFGNFTFDNQWNGDIFDPTRPTNENFNDPSILYPDFGVGLNLRTQSVRYSPKQRNKMDFGVGVFHFNQPNLAFQNNDKIELPIRWSMYALPNLQLTNKVDLVGAASFQLQGPNWEALGAAGVKYFLSTKKSKEVAVQLGINFRFNQIGDALIPAAELQYRDWMVGLSWDVNLSGFSTATKYNGGPEITVRYIIHKVYPFGAFKACPLI
jgi:type IX secretion system PorP/SprF family membrane protein